mgnify:CR=1 FL=1
MGFLTRMGGWGGGGGGECIAGPMELRGKGAFEFTGFGRTVDPITTREKIIPATKTLLATLFVTLRIFRSSDSFAWRKITRRKYVVSTD